MQNVEDTHAPAGVTRVGETDGTCGDFCINGKSYVIRFSQKRISMYERNGKPIMAAFVQNGGAFSIDELKSLVAYGLQEEGGMFVNPKQGLAMAEGLLEENGYAALCQRVFEALERDCPFLFMG